jgi:hypothetical protein
MSCPIGQIQTNRQSIPRAYRDDDQPSEGFGELEHPAERIKQLADKIKEVARLEATGANLAKLKADDADQILNEPNV